jgi:hypothetical protein
VNSPIAMSGLQGVLPASGNAISPPVLILLLLSLWVAYKFTSILRDPLRTVPGPFVARFTRLWYLSKVWQGTFEKTNIALHKKHGNRAGSQHSDSRCRNADPVRLDCAYCTELLLFGWRRRYQNDIRAWQPVDCARILVEKLSRFADRQVSINLQGQYKPAFFSSSRRSKLQY